MSDFIEVARLDEVPPGRGTTVTVAGKDVALFNVDGTIYAMENACLHQGLSLGTGNLEGKVVTRARNTGARIMGVQTEWNQAVM